MPDAGRDDQRQSRPSQRDDLFDTVEHGSVVGDVAIDVAHRSKRKEDAPVVWLVDQLWCDVLESVQTEVWGPVQTSDHLIGKIVIEDEV